MAAYAYLGRVLKSGHGWVLRSLSGCVLCGADEICQSRGNVFDSIYQKHLKITQSNKTNNNNNNKL